MTWRQTPANVFEGWWQKLWHISTWIEGLRL